jgi:hypothetical protein
MRLLVRKRGGGREWLYLKKFQEVSGPRNGIDKKKI